jgi:hypothetical protein
MTSGQSRLESRLQPVLRDRREAAGRRGEARGEHQKRPSAWRQVATHEDLLAVCETLCDRVSGGVRCLLCGRDMAVAFRVVSSRTIWCLAYLYSKCYAFPESQSTLLHTRTGCAVGFYMCSMLRHKFCASRRTLLPLQCLPNTKVCNRVFCVLLTGFACLLQVTVKAGEPYELSALPMMMLRFGGKWPGIVRASCVPACMDAMEHLFSELWGICAQHGLCTFVGPSPAV